jgi:hypothetical protein
MLVLLRVEERYLKLDSQQTRTERTEKYYQFPTPVPSALYVQRPSVLLMAQMPAGSRMARTRENSPKQPGSRHISITLAKLMTQIALFFMESTKPSLTKDIGSLHNFGAKLGFDRIDNSVSVGAKWSAR